MHPQQANPANWRRDPDHGPLSGSNRRRRKYRSRFEHEPLNDSQRDLAIQYLPLARKLARPLKQIFVQWRDEFESAACLALVEAARSYDPGLNIRFATFARYRIRGALMDVGRAMQPSGFENDPDEAPGFITLTPYNEEHGSVLVAVEPPPVGTESDDIDAVEHLLRQLPKRHAEICRLYYLYGKTQAEIGRTMGCSQSEVTRLHRKSIDLLSDPHRPIRPKRGRGNWRKSKLDAPSAVADRASLVS